MCSKCFRCFCCCWMARKEKEYSDVEYAKKEIEAIAEAFHLPAHHVRSSEKMPGWFSINVTPNQSPRETQEAKKMNS